MGVHFSYINSRYICHLVKVAKRRMNEDRQVVGQPGFRLVFVFNKFK